MASPEHAKRYGRVKGSTISLSLDPDTVTALDSRTGEGGSRSETARQIIARYAAMCARELPELSIAEWNLCRDALNGAWLLDDQAVRFLEHEIADACKLNRLDVKWSEWAVNNGHAGIDAADLVARLATLGYASRLALVDSVERWWRRENSTTEDAP